MSSLRCHATLLRSLQLGRRHRPLHDGTGPFHVGTGPLDAGTGPLDAGAGPLDASTGTLGAGTGLLAAGTATRAASLRATGPSVPFQITIHDTVRHMEEKINNL